MNKHSSINNTKVCSVSRTARLVKQAYMDMDISMDIHGKSVDMDMDMDEKFHPRQAWKSGGIFRLKWKRAYSYSYNANLL